MGNEQYLTGKFRFQFCQCQMSGVGLHGVAQQLPATQVIELVNQCRVGGKTFWRCDILNAVFFPQTIGSAEGFYPRLGGNARAGKNDNALISRSHSDLSPLPLSHLRTHRLSTLH